MDQPPLRRISWRGAARLIPTRYPSVGLFDRVASADDLEAIVELESWTNDRVNVELGVLHTIPREEWVTGRSLASVVMAAFCHPHPRGARFSDAQRGAWYASRPLETALAESAFRRTQELQEVGVLDARVQMRLYLSDFRATFHDIRGADPAFAPLYDPESYAASQEFARRLLAAGSHGVVYRSVRHRGGECIACFRPKLVQNVRAAAHYEFRWTGTPTPEISRLAAST